MGVVDKLLNAHACAVRVCVYMHIYVRAIQPTPTIFGVVFFLTVHRDEVRNVHSLYTNIIER